MNDHEFIESLRKDLPITLPDKISQEELKQRLADHINYLILHDFNQLVNYLYRIDVQEEKLKQLLISHPGEDASLIIANLAIERLARKIKSKKDFTVNGDGINDDEKW